MKIFTVAAAVILLALFTGCGDSGPIKIGFVATLSGSSAGLGVTGRNAVRLAIEEINNNGGINGRKLQLVIADDKGNAEGGLRAAKELVAQKVVAVIGHSLTGTQALSLPYFQKNQILMLSPSVTTSTLSGRDDNFIKLAGSNDEQALALADYALLKKNFNRFVVIYDINNRGYSEGIVHPFAENVTRTGGEIVYLRRFNSGDNETLTKIADTLKLLSFDAILAVANGMDNAIFCQLLKKNNISVPVLAPMWATTEDLVTYGGTGAEKIVTVNNFDWEDKSPKYIKFRRRYLKKYKTEPTFAAAYAYEAAQILSAAISTSSSLNYGELKSHIVNRNFSGLQQDIHIDATGDVNRKLTVLGIRKGKFIKLEQ